MKRLLIILAGLTAGGVGYHLYNKNKKKEKKNVLKIISLNKDDKYIIYFDENEGTPIKEELFI